MWKLDLYIIVLAILAATICLNGGSLAIWILVLYLLMLRILAAALIELQDKIKNG